MTEVAVFVRNHVQYLDRACEISANDPSRPVTFRSSKKWVTAKKALDEQVVIRAYLSPTGSDGQVIYSAIIKNIVLDPHKGDEDTDRSLAKQLPETVNEDLWSQDDGPVKTLYEVSHCKRLSSSFSMTQLRKASDGKPISENYGYSYVPVLRLESEAESFFHPDEVENPEQFVEGAVRRVAVNSYERSAKAREACINHYGVSCVVCELNFERIYGVVGNGFIHVHHLKPLGSIGEGYEVDPVEDLRPVCPNCHAMLHRKNPPFTPEELINLMRRDE
ncbi:HNH endonuclease [Marinobacterium rhizophilum]|uniref:HNH endonuclease n=1 Tax=Marinobacterium rhizophilum TaxID=420402 RepID=UPI00036DEDC7|nr:HNH endonuclease [Marinobacterium rhizophilum]